MILPALSAWSRLGVALPLALTLLASCSSTVVRTMQVERESAIDALSVPASTVSVDVSTRNGAVSVRVDTAASGVAVRAELEAGGRTAREAEERLARMDFELHVDDDGVVRVRPLVPGGWRSGDGASFEIVVPALGSAVIATSNGTVSLAGATRASRVDTSNGGVRATDCTGPLELSSSNGPVTVARSKGTLSIDTSNAAIAVDGHSGFVDGHTSNGAVQCRLVVGSFQLRTSNASIDVRVPESWDGSVAASTSNGQVVFETSAGSMGEFGTRAELAMGEGGGTSRAKTSNGSILVHTW